MSAEIAARVRELHRVAMNAADKGDFFRRQLKESGDAEFYAAFVLERAAADLCAEEPMRCVLYRSAATLALDAGMPAEARRLAECGLAGSPPAEIADELREVLARCDDVS